MEKKYELAGKVYSASMLAHEIAVLSGRLSLEFASGSTLSAEMRQEIAVALADVIQQHAEHAQRLLAVVYKEL